MTEDMQGLADKLNRMGNKFEQKVHRLEVRQDRQFGLLDARLKQMETIQGSGPQTIVRSTAATDSGMSIYVSPLPAPEAFLPLAAKLAAVNPAQQNPKLISQALSTMPPALNAF